MRRFGIAVAVALMAAALSPATALAAKKGDVDAKARAEGMAKAPALAQQAGVACQIADARFIGKMEDKKAKTTTEFYEVDCDQGLGFVIQAVEGQTPAAFNCLATSQPGEDGKPNGLACKLPGNANPMADLAPLIAKAAIQCTPEKARSIGDSATNSFLEVACQGGAGYILVASTPPSPDKPVQATTCLAYTGEGNIKCTLTDAAAALKVIDPLVASSGKNCAIKDRRYILTSKDGSDYYEVACTDGKGYVLEVAGGALKRTIDCANASFVGGGCTMTDARAAQTQQADLYTKLATAAGFKCDVASYAPLQTTSEREVIELKCSDRPDGGIGVFPVKGTAKVYDCGHAELMGFRCALNKGPQTKTSLTADLKSLGKNSCTVADNRVVGKTASGSVYMEVTCSDGLAGYMIEYKTEPAVKATVATVCTMAKGLAGGCKMPANVKASS